MSTCSEALSELPAEEELKDKALVRETENEANGMKWSRHQGCFKPKPDSQTLIEELRKTRSKGYVNWFVVQSPNLVAEELYIGQRTCPSRNQKPPPVR